MPIALRAPAGRSGRPEIRFCELLPEYGSATSALRATMPDGREVKIFTERGPEAHAQVAVDPNAPFKLWNTPLFPLTNRLRDRGAGTPDARPVVLGKPVQAEVLGTEVTLPRNHGDCHLHGLLYSTKPSRAPEPTSESRVVIQYRDFFKGQWVGDAELEVEHTLRDGAFFYSMRARNVGSETIPVGFGSHPYFEAPSGSAENLKLFVPASKYAEITNLNEVFPTGRLLPVTGSEIDFSREARAFSNQFLDNFWTDLIPDGEGFPFAELTDEKAGIRIRMTATTRNVRGVQVYYPQKGSSVAVELVTHLPDPRAELWGLTDPGMQRLAPGESAEFGFRIDVFAL